MSTQTMTPYGSWKSPITSDLITEKAVAFFTLFHEGNDLYWGEMRPNDEGRYVPLKNGKDLLPSPYSARTTVHEYGGASCFAHKGAFYFSNFNDQHFYKLEEGGEPQKISKHSNMRYANASFHAEKPWMVCVREEHKKDGEVINSIVRLRLDEENDGDVLVLGNDFYASPVLNADGTKLAWLTWNFPNMPWDGTELWVADISERGELSNSRRIAGGETEYIFQPTWTPENTLVFTSDKTGYSNLYLWKNEQATELYPMSKEFAAPLWHLGQKTFVVSPEKGAHTLYCTFNDYGDWRLGKLNILSGIFEEIPCEYTSISGLSLKEDTLYFVGSSASSESAIVKMNLKDSSTEVLKRSRETKVDSRYLSAPQAIEFPTEGGETAHAWYYPPKNEDYEAPSGELPPLLVKIHGGPTAQATSSLSLQYQYWTSRGFAIVDVNYGGSTGYGREYQDRLLGQWGIVDVDDCTYAAKYLVDKGLVDPKRLCIDGGSAGGFTTLACLAFRDTFTAGCSLFGVSDLVSMTETTHKFESRYLERLVGPYPQREDLFKQRSPINHVHKFSAPMLILQGAEDKIVPPEQAELIYEAIKEKGLPVSYILFEGEQHGFRKAKNIKRALEAEFLFFARVFGFDPADEIESLEIENM